MSAPSTTRTPALGTATRAGSDSDVRPAGLLVYLLFGTFFGLLLVKSEVVSWFRIQEMFRFQSFHMYGIIGSAVVVAALSLLVIRRLGLKDRTGRPIVVAPKPFQRGTSQILGGFVFGLGWALLGACPGPVYALIGSGVTVMVVALVSAAGGAWVYGHLRPRLPH